MYISCGDDAVAVEAEMGYVPNNPLFGLPLDSPQVITKYDSSHFKTSRHQKKFAENHITHHQNLNTTTNSQNSIYLSV